jgi:hypothetical protein
VTIRAIDFINVPEAVYALNSTDITVVDSRYLNITGPAQPRTGANVANFVQLNRVTRALIDHNKGRGGDTEDIVSVYDSDDVTVSGNHFEGTNWTSGSGSGIALGDGGGNNNVARNNIVVNPGQVGIFIAGGTGSRIENNVIIGEQRASSNIGIYVSNYSGGTCSSHAVTGNRVYWRRADGALNSYWTSGNCGTVQMSGNIFGTPIDISAYRVVL